LIFEFFCKVHGEDSILIEIGQEEQVVYMKANTHLWYYLPQFFLDSDVLQTKVIAKLKHVLCSIMFFENRPIYEVCGKEKSTAGWDTDYNMAHAHCMRDT